MRFGNWEAELAASAPKISLQVNRTILLSYGDGLLYARLVR